MPISLSALVRDIVESIKTIHVNSISQKVSDKNTVCFEGAVEVFIDENLHIWADKVTINKEKQFLKAETVIGACVKVEGNDFVLLADSIFVNLNDRSFKADNIKLDLDGRYITAKKAEKTSTEKWRIFNLKYTACNKDFPHWSFQSTFAQAQKYAIQAQNILFKIGTFPIIWLPGIIVPSQKKSNSGFLLPRLMLNKRYGFCYDQAFYLDIMPNLDSTFGFNIKQKEGLEIYNQFRRGRSSESYMILDSKYVRDWNFLTEKDSKIVKSKKGENRYEIEGFFFDRMRFSGFWLHHLARVNIASDLRIDYDFFSRTDDVEDRYINNWTSRIFNSRNQAFVSFSSDKVFREKFFNVSKNHNNFKEEQVDRFLLVRVPHLEWNTAFYNLFSNINYKHNMFFDGVFFGRQFTIREIAGLDIVGSQFLRLIPRDSTARLYYESTIEQSFKLDKSLFNISFSPNIQFRSRIKQLKDIKHSIFNQPIMAEGAYRILVKSKAELALPPVSSYSKDMSRAYFEQDVITWTFIPKYTQRQWFLVDEYDKIFPTNQIKFESKHFVYLDDFQFDLIARLSYDFYRQRDLLPIVRFSPRSFAVPLSVNGGVQYKDHGVSFLWEFDLLRRVLVQSQLDANFRFGDVLLDLSWIYQTPQIQKVRNLFSNIPTFFTINFKVPFNKLFCVNYFGQYYSNNRSVLGFVITPRVLLHRIKLDYIGHCWGISIGYERKQNRQEGIPRPETSYFVSFNLESLGSFAKRFRYDKQIQKAPTNYD